jgi:hypothetical protein
LEQDNPDLGYDAAKGLPFSFQYPNGKKYMISWIVICHVALILTCFLFVIGEYVDMVKSGIIDPLKVIRTALVDAARYL